MNSNMSRMTSYDWEEQQKYYGKFKRFCKFYNLSTTNTVLITSGSSGLTLVNLINMMRGFHEKDPFSFVIVRRPEEKPVSCIALPYAIADDLVFEEQVNIVFVDSFIWKKNTIGRCLAYDWSKELAQICWCTEPPVRHLACCASEPESEAEPKYVSQSPHNSGFAKEWTIEVNGKTVESFDEIE